MGSHLLDCLFAPKSIAVFGASERDDSVGGRVLRNLRADGFAGALYPVNPKYDQVLGERCYRRFADIGAPVDLAVVATPATTVPGIVHECGERGARAAIVYSAGFAEAHDQAAGASLLTALLDEARRYRMRVLGPNCLGLIRPSARLNASFSNSSAQPGTLALVSQSGALCTAILDWAESRSIGFSAVVSLGEAADVDFGEVLDYLALDPHTRGILLYIEGIRDARHFMSGLRVAARMKPVVAVKAGRHAEGSRAAATHTGALVGADDVFDAVLMRAGAVRVMTVEQLFATAQLLAAEHRVRGNRLAIVTNAGGPGVLAVDRAIDLGAVVAPLEPAALAKLDRALPRQWSHANPVDVLGDADAERFRVAVETCIADPNVDGILAILTPQAMTDALGAARATIDAARGSDKLVLASWMGESLVAAARELFAAHRIPAFPSPESAVEAFAYLAAYDRNQKLLRQVPERLAPRNAADVEPARGIVDAALAERRGVLTGAEARAVLSAFGIPILPAFEASDAAGAVAAAETLGYPVALKIRSPQISHKSEVNGVRLNLGNAEVVRSVYADLVESVRRQRPQADIAGVTVERMYARRDGRELNLGVVRDPIFGPVVSFGLGGTMVEVLRDRALALPPFNSLIIEDLIQRTRAAMLLGAFRGWAPVNRVALEQVLLALSEMVCELPQIVELDINPLVADPEGATALDMRILVAAPAPGLRRYAHLTIEPYPNHLVTRMRLADGTDVVLRPIRPEDSDIEAAFVRDLSLNARYFRFMQALQELTPDMLVRFTQIDYDRELALIAVIERAGKELEIAVARYGMNPDSESCEFAIVVADAWQGKGIGTRLLTLLMAAAKARGFKVMEGEVMAQNVAMLDMAKHLGFRISQTAGTCTIAREL